MRALYFRCSWAFYGSCCVCRWILQLSTPVPVFFTSKKGPSLTATAVPFSIAWVIGWLSWGWEVLARIQSVLFHLLKEKGSLLSWVLQPVRMRLLSPWQIIAALTLSISLWIPFVSYLNCGVWPKPPLYCSVSKFSLVVLVFDRVADFELNKIITIMGLVCKAIFLMYGPLIHLCMESTAVRLSSIL